MKKRLLLVGLMAIGMLVGCGGNPSSEAPASEAPSQGSSVAAHTHEYDAGEVTKAATCEENGTKTKHCTVEGCDKTKTETIAALGHKWDEGKVTKESSCGTPGEKTFTCLNDGCGKTKTEEIAAPEHEFEDANTGEAFTVMKCKNDGATYLARPSLLNGKWDKTKDNEWVYKFTVGKATKARLQIQANVKANGDKSLICGVGSTSDDFDDANPGAERMSVTVNGEKAAITTKTYEELGILDENGAKAYFDLVESLDLVEGENEIKISTPAGATFRLDIGGEVRLFVDEYVKGESEEVPVPVAHAHSYKDVTTDEAFKVYECSCGDAYMATPSLQTGKWDKTNGGEWKYNFAVGAATKATLQLCANVTGNGDKSLICGVGSGTDDYETAHPGEQRMCLKVNGVDVPVTTATYNEMGIYDTSGTRHYFDFADIDLKEGDNEITVSVPAGATFRLDLGGEVRVKVDEYVKVGATAKTPAEKAKALGKFQIAANEATPDATYTIADGVLTLDTADGIYDIYGCFEGQVVIPATVAAKVTLNMNYAAIVNENGACVDFLSGSKNITIVSAEGTKNYLVSGTKDGIEQDFACVKSANNIHIKGPGELNVYAYGGHAFNGSSIEFKENANVNVTAAGDVLHGKEVIMLNGVLNVNGAQDVIDVDLNSKGKKGTFQMVNGTIIANNVETVVYAESKVEIGKTDYVDGEAIPFDETLPCLITATNVLTPAGIVAAGEPTINEKATVTINGAAYVYVAPVTE